MKSILFFVYKGKTRRGGEEQKRRGKRKRWRRRRSNNIPLFSPPRGKRSRTSVSTISSPPVSLLPLPLLSEIPFPLLSFHDRKLPSKVRKLGEEWCEVACVCVRAGMCLCRTVCLCEWEDERALIWILGRKAREKTVHACERMAMMCVHVTPHYAGFNFSICVFECVCACMHAFVCSWALSTHIISDKWWLLSSLKQEIETATIKKKERRRQREKHKG